MKTLLRLLLAAVACAAPARAAAQPLHLVLTPSQKPTDLLAAGEEFGRVLGELLGTPVRVTVASDYAAVIEALRNQTADLAFVHPAGYVLANREAKAKIVVQNLWHGISNGAADAAAPSALAGERPLKVPAEAGRSVFGAEPPPIPEAGIAARSGLDPAMFTRVRDALIRIRAPEHGDLLRRLYNID